MKQRKPDYYRSRKYEATSKEKSCRLRFTKMDSQRRREMLYLNGASMAERANAADSKSVP